MENDSCKGGRKSEDLHCNPKKGSPSEIKSVKLGFEETRPVMSRRDYLQNMNRDALNQRFDCRSRIESTTSDSDSEYYGRRRVKRPMRETPDSFRRSLTQSSPFGIHYETLDDSECERSSLFDDPVFQLELQEDYLKAKERRRKLKQLAFDLQELNRQYEEDEAQEPIPVPRKRTKTSSAMKGRDDLLKSVLAFNSKGQHSEDRYHDPTCIDSSCSRRACKNLNFNSIKKRNSDWQDQNREKNKRNLPDSIETDSLNFADRPSKPSKAYSTLCLSDLPCSRQNKSLSTSLTSLSHDKMSTKTPEQRYVANILMEIFETDNESELNSLLEEGSCCASVTSNDTHQVDGRSLNSDRVVYVPNNCYEATLSFSEDSDCSSDLSLVFKDDETESETEEETTCVISQIAAVGETNEEGCSKYSDSLDNSASESYEDSARYGLLRQSSRHDYSESNYSSEAVEYDSWDSEEESTQHDQGMNCELQQSRLAQGFQSDASGCSSYQNDQDQCFLSLDENTRNFPFDSVEICSDGGERFGKLAEKSVNNISVSPDQCTARHFQGVNDATNLSNLPIARLKNSIISRQMSKQSHASSFGSEVVNYDCNSSTNGLDLTESIPGLAPSMGDVDEDSIQEVSFDSKDQSKEHSSDGSSSCSEIDVSDHNKCIEYFHMPLSHSSSGGSPSIYSDKDGSASSLNKDEYFEASDQFCEVLTDGNEYNRLPSPDNESIFEANRSIGPPLNCSTIREFDKVFRKERSLDKHRSFEIDDSDEEDSLVDEYEDSNSELVCYDMDSLSAISANFSDFDNSDGTEPERPSDLDFKYNPLFIQTAKTSFQEWEKVAHMEETKFESSKATAENSVYYSPIYYSVNKSPQTHSTFYNIQEKSKVGSSPATTFEALDYTSAGQHCARISTDDVEQDLGQKKLDDIKACIEKLATCNLNEKENLDVMDHCNTGGTVFSEYSEKADQNYLGSFNARRNTYSDRKRPISSDNANALSAVGKHSSITDSAKRARNEYPNIERSSSRNSFYDNNGSDSGQSDKQSKRKRKSLRRKLTVNCIPPSKLSKFPTSPDDYVNYHSISPTKYTELVKSTVPDTASYKGYNKYAGFNQKLLNRSKFILQTDEPMKTQHLNNENASKIKASIKKRPTLAHIRTYTPADVPQIVDPLYKREIDRRKEIVLSHQIPSLQNTSQSHDKGNSIRYSTNCSSICLCLGLLTLISMKLSYISGKCLAFSHLVPQCIGTNDAIAFLLY